MKSRILRIALLVPLLAALGNAQYAVGSASSSFLPIAGVTGATMLPVVSGCDDCTEAIALPFTFPWFTQAVTSVSVTSNGAILMGPFLDSLCCSNWALDYGTAGGTPTYFTPLPWIAVAQEDLNPGFQGDIWRFDTGGSTIISWENVAFFGTTGSSLNAQVELFANGDIEIRFATSNSLGNNISSGLTNPGTPNVWFSPNSVDPLFNAVGQTTGGAPPQNSGVRFAFIPPTPTWETNSPTSSLTLGGAQGTSFTKAVASDCVGAGFAVTSLGTAGQGWEIAYNLSPTVPAGSAGSFTTPGGQIVNLDLTQGLFFLFGGTGPVLLPHPGTFNAVVPVLPGTLSAQQLVLDPTNPEGVALSQACQLDGLSLSLPALPFAGPTFDDSDVVVPLGCVRAYGRSFTQGWIESNGRFIFGATGYTGFTPYVAQFQADGASFGVWTDLNPSAGGSINLTSPLPGVFSVNYNAVAYFAAAGSFATFQLEVDTNSGALSIIGLTGLPAGGGQMLIGASGGSAVGATDAGPAAFSPGGLPSNGTTPNATQMIYMLGLQGSVTSGINRIDFIVNGFGNYDWYSS